ncbi:14789_t:CDS:1, partial [Gigaspora rosea]
PFVLCNAKSKAVMTGTRDVEMNANSLSGTKNATNNTGSTIIRSNRTRNAKIKAISAMENNKGPNVNSAK